MQTNALRAMGCPGRKPRTTAFGGSFSSTVSKLRQEMRAELKTLQRETGITFIFVTHDQEALTMSDRIAVMAEGRVQQIGAPDAIYEHPVNRFVAGFIGETNLLRARASRLEEGLARCALDGGGVLLAEADEARPDQPVTLSLRPEKVRLVEERGADLAGTIEDVVYLGTDSQVSVRLDGGTRLVARVQNAWRDRRFGRGERVGLAIRPGAARVLAD
ncbi:MAG TPA: ABC transporter ATP-binding protein [Geminicoccaceae bacterium]